MQMWLDDWLHSAPHARDGVPLVTLLCLEGTTVSAFECVFLKVYDPTTGTVDRSWSWFDADGDSSGLLRWLRFKTGLDVHGRWNDLLVWRENEPDSSRPTWEALELDFRLPLWGQLGVVHGDLLVV